jgi:hypothetical protein
MNDVISIKKVTEDNHDYPIVKFNPDEQISMQFIQESVFSLIVTAIHPLPDHEKVAVVESIKQNMSKLDLIEFSKTVKIL